MKRIDDKNNAPYIFLIIAALGIALFLGTCVEYGPSTHKDNAPMITLLGNAVDTVQVGIAYVDSGATATDIEDGDLTDKIVVNYGTLDTANPVAGTHTITYSVTDSEGIKSSLNRTVIVANFPTITLLGKAVDTVPAGVEYVDSGTTATDIEDGDLTGAIEVDYGILDTLHPSIGTYTITYSVTDKGGNIDTANRTVVVANFPIITLRGKTIDTVQAGTKYIDSGATAFDYEDGNLTDSIIVDYGTLDTVNPVESTYTITYSAADRDGNTGTANRTVVVVTSIQQDTTKITELLDANSLFDDTNTVYLITQSLTVPEGNSVTFGRRTLIIAQEPIFINGTFTIEEGARFLMAEETYMGVGTGTLSINGTATDTVFFENYTADIYWGYDGGSSSSSYALLFSQNASAASSVNFCAIDSGTTGINVQKDGIVITNSTIKNSTYAGVHFYRCGPKDSASFVKNHFVGNGATSSFYPLEINAEYLHRLSGTATFTANSAQAILVESGTAKNTGTWRKHTVPYLFDGGTDINNTDGVTITIEPGTVLQFKQNASLMVDAATLIASATAIAPITFSNYENGQYWGNDGNNSNSSYGILFTANANANSVLNYCMIDSGTTGININKDGITITNTTVQYCLYAGMYFSECGPKDSASFVNNHFIGNGTTSSFYPLEINAAYCSRLSGIGTFTANSAQAILVESGTVENTGTWRKHTVSYVFEEGTVIANTNGVTITIEPGTVLQFKKNAYLTVDAATLIASATAAYPITFSNYVNGQHWGNDGNNSNNSFSIHFTANANANSILNYCIIDSGTTGLNVKKDGITISNTTVQYCQYAGMYFSACGPKDSSTYVNNSFIGNGSTNSFYPLCLSAAYLHRLSGSLLFTNNTNNAILIDPATVAVSGSWKKQTVPYAFNTGQVVIDNTNGVQVTINPGAVFKFLATSTIMVDNGTFIANGTASEVITFTNWIQGQYWGIDDGAGYNSYGIVFTNETNANSSVSYCSFSNATQAINSRNSPLAVSNSTITNCKYYGLYSNGTGNANIDTASITFTGNGSGDYLHED